MKSQLAPWAKKTNGVAYRKIDIVSGESDAAKQARSEYGMEGIPYVRVYGKSGDFLGDVVGADFEGIKKLAEQGL